MRSCCYKRGFLRGTHLHAMLCGTCLRHAAWCVGSLRAVLWQWAGGGLRLPQAKAPSTVARLMILIRPESHWQGSGSLCLEVGVGRGDPRAPADSVCPPWCAEPLAHSRYAAECVLRRARKGQRRLRARSSRLPESVAPPSRRSREKGWFVQQEDLLRHLRVQPTMIFGHRHSVL